MVDTVVDSVGHQVSRLGNALLGPYWESQYAGVSIHTDNGSDHAYNYHSSIGIGATTRTGGTNLASNAYFEPQTPGLTNPIVHMALLGNTGAGAGTLTYKWFHVRGGSELQTVTIISTLSNGAIGTNYTVITVTRSGNIILGYTNPAASGGYKSTDGGQTWVVIASPFEGGAIDNAWGASCNTGDNNDAAIVFYDRSAAELSIKVYDDSIDTWVETSIATGIDTVTGSSLAIKHGEGNVRLSDGHYIFAHWSQMDNVAADLRCWDLNINSVSAPTVTALGDVVTNLAESGLCTLFIDQTNDDIYVAYGKGDPTWGTSVSIVYRKSTTGGSSFGSEQAMSEDAPANLCQLSATAMGPATRGGRFQPLWFNAATLNTKANEVNDLAIASSLDGTSTTTIQHLPTTRPDPASGALRFCLLFGQHNAYYSSKVSQLIIAPTFLYRLKIQLAAAMATGATRTWWIYVNNQPTALTVTISAGETEGTALPNLFLNEGDLVSLGTSSTGVTGTIAPFYVSTTIINTLPNFHQAFFTNTSALALVVGNMFPAMTYMGSVANPAADSSDSSAARGYVGTPNAVITRFGCLNGASGVPMTATGPALKLRKNSVDIVGATVAVTSYRHIHAITTGLTAALVADDYVSMEVTATAGNAGGWTTGYTSPTGASYGGQSPSAPSSTAINYTQPGDYVASSWSATESAVYVIATQTMQITDLKVRLVTAPGASKSRTFQWYVNGVATGPLVTISGTDLTGLALGSFEVPIGATFSLGSTPTGTPTSPGTVHWYSNYSQPLPPGGGGGGGAGKKDPRGRFWDGLNYLHPALQWDWSNRLNSVLDLGLRGRPEGFELPRIFNDDWRQGWPPGIFPSIATGPFFFDPPGSRRVVIDSNPSDSPGIDSNPSDSPEIDTNPSDSPTVGGI